MHPLHPNLGDFAPVRVNVRQGKSLQNLVKFELQSVADLATPTEKQGYQDRLREKLLNDSNPTKRAALQMKSFFPTSQLQLHAHFQFLTLCQTHPQNVGDGDVRGASNHDLEHSKKCMKSHKTARVRSKEKIHRVQCLQCSVFFRSFGSFCQCFTTNPQCLDRLPAHWLPVLPSTGFVANLERSKKSNRRPQT